MIEFTNEDAIKHIDEHIKSMERLKDKFKPKPKQKIIRLDEVIGSDIDMEFTNLEDFKIQPYHTAVGKLTGFDNSTGNNYTIKNDVDKYTKCRIRQDHPHANVWDKCPLPEGLDVEIAYNQGGISGKITDYMNLEWHEVCYFYVYGTTPTHRYEWQKEKEE